MYIYLGISIPMIGISKNIQQRFAGIDLVWLLHQGSDKRAYTYMFNPCAQVCIQAISYDDLNMLGSQVATTEILITVCCIF
jgi:hypothetical protein